MSTDNKTLIERLFNAGAHFGFSKSRRHPTIAPYIFTNKMGTDIFDLEQTAQLLEDAKSVLRKAGEEGKKVLFVGTKDEVSEIVKTHAEQAEMPLVVNRWIGGMITNFSEIRKRVERLKALMAERESGELEQKYTKKERVLIGREIDKLTFNFEGILNLDKVPQMLLVVDPRHDSIAVQEANDRNIPVVAVMSSDCDKNKVTHPVIVNDALRASVTFVLDELTDAYVEGFKKYTPPSTPARNARTERPRSTHGRSRR